MVFSLLICHFPFSGVVPKPPRSLLQEQEAGCSADPSASEVSLPQPAKPSPGSLWLWGRQPPPGPDYVIFSGIGLCRYRQFACCFEPHFTARSCTTQKQQHPLELWRYFKALLGFWILPGWQNASLCNQECRRLCYPGRAMRRHAQHVLQCGWPDCTVGCPTTAILRSCIQGEPANTIPWWYAWIVFPCLQRLSFDWPRVFCCFDGLLSQFRLNSVRTVALNLIP